MSENVRLSQKQEKALSALLTEPTIRAAALCAGVSERQLHRYLSEEGFRQAYEQARGEAFNAALSSLQVGAGAAVSLLRELIQSDAETPVVRLNAATKLLAFSIKARELQDVEERLAELERRVEIAKL